MRTNFWLPLLAALLASTACYAAAPPPPRGDPLKGVVLGDSVVTCELVEACSVVVHVHSLGKDQKTPGRGCAFSKKALPRWQIGQGRFWVSEDWDILVPHRPPEVGAGGLRRFDLALFSNKEEDIFHCPDADFMGETPADQVAFDAFDSRYFLYFDFLPAGKFQARQFMATNLRGKRHDRHKDFEEGKSPACVFSSYLGESRWDAKDRVWKPLPWKREWSTPAAFNEPFQALSLCDDFYFVTRSGSLYRAAKPAKGTDRVLARVWDGKERPIRSFITDAATGKTFLFVPPAKAGGKPAFFELSDKPKLVEYDPKAVPLPPLEEPHRTILHNARILVALKKIEGKPAAKAEGKK